MLLYFLSEIITISLKIVIKKIPIIKIDVAMGVIILNKDRPEERITVISLLKDSE